MAKFNNARLFEDELPEFNGMLLVDTKSFIGTKFKEVLDEIGLDYETIDLMMLSQKLIRFFDIGLGPNFYVIKDGKPIKHISRLMIKEDLEKELELI